MSLIITLNGEPTDISVTTVRELLESRGIDPSMPGVAVALNDRVIRRSEWPSTTIAGGDRIEIITAMQGG